LIVNAVKIHAYRVLSPQWAYQPHSGAGAAKAGGRFNRPGQQAVYLSLEPETAIAEYAQADPVFGPGTIATYELFLALVVDFSVQRQMGFALAGLGLRLEAALLPPTWLMSDIVRARASALLFPSTKRAGGTNLVL
jgi:RES domain-containing protein